MINSKKNISLSVEFIHLHSDRKIKKVFYYERLFTKLRNRCSISAEY